MTKIVLAGTPEFSVPIFEEIIKNFEVVAIVTQPDKPAKRGQNLQESPVKKLALKYNLKLFQPEKISMIYEELKELDFDYMLTAAFGQYIPENILNLPKKFPLNIHGSLLPKYRGAAPIQHALLNNETETGVQLIIMTKKMDAGDILKEAKIKIEESDISLTLFEKLSNLAAENIVSWIHDLDQNNYQRIIQDESKVTLASKLLKKDSFLDKTKTKKENIAKIKAFALNPGARYINENNKLVKVYFATENKIKNAPVFTCVDGDIFLNDYQIESKKRVTLK
ncbi:methionyl-tRNA formyltransferase [Mycoplasmopsis synoviae]|uniref:Methionyl-tRNA formyltransferase n=1 Tax=Mycoplasmopsis synoviae TaxID=2109 RepID=A0AAX3EZS0_MYCSY|nr:methionyl-tRNA formyltransferase [Mycoplasmopsis synoviae]QGL45463.1 methionyl-tRNA formyltransferase [Mycoplasmopsis synoviae]QXV99327.1 methionyl-tRNA formyltransferase [Mycoplasmopsis synoviae]UBM43506.1 methionyl-tRNA formyltransferase [Mycoplasmopsis synoviae]ULL02278.1 methionyl-tRNA formyltransferase [Mycoplasmopsis synoviae]UZW64288.1 methionyl-tRNA formyltransferase [Mycoplasmopsis synoviae]